MKIIYYTRPCYLDLAYSYAAELSKLVELHIVIEIAPESRQCPIFDIEDQELQAGVYDGTPFLRQKFPKLFISYLADCASITLVVHNCTKSIHPTTWKISLEAMNYCRSIDPDIIHFDEISLRTAWGIWTLKKYPLICSIHDPVAHSGEKNWRKTLTRNISFPFVDRFLLHSITMQKTFIYNYPRLSPDKVVHNLLAAYDIFCQWIDYPLQDNGKTILFFGRLSPYKGLDVLLQAAPIIAEQIKEVHIVIAGRPIAGYTLPALPDLANGGKFEILDTYIDNSRLAKLFQQATVVVCPYIDATQSGVVLTAYAFTKPVIATNTGGLPEYIWPDKTGLLVAAGDHQQLAEATISILDQPEIQQKFKSNIEETKKAALNWKHIARKSVSIYSDLLTTNNDHNFRNNQ